MVHTLCSSDQGELSYLQRLWSRMFAPGLDLRERIEQFLAAEGEEFGLEYAFLTYVDLEAAVQHFEIVNGAHDTLKAGNTVPLQETYCRKTIADPDGTVVVSDAAAEGWAGDPAYETYGLGSYIGTTISVEGGLYGTLYFANAEPRPHALTDEEKTLVEMHGQWVANELNRWAGPPTHDPVRRTLDTGDISAAQITAMMDALRDPARRSILRTLVDVPAETSVDELERVLDSDHPRAELAHRHLPKLEELAYIDWHSGSDTISRGPDFSDVEPLVRLLSEYRSALRE